MHIKTIFKNQVIYYLNEAKQETKHIGGLFFLVVANTIGVISD